MSHNKMTLIVISIYALSLAASCSDTTSSSTNNNATATQSNDTTSLPSPEFLWVTKNIPPSGIKNGEQYWILQGGFLIGEAGATSGAEQMTVYIPEQYRRGGQYASTIAVSIACNLDTGQFKYQGSNFSPTIGQTYGFELPNGNQIIASPDDADSSTVTVTQLLRGARDVPRK